MDLAINNLQWLICHKTKPKNQIDIYLHILSPCILPSKREFILEFKLFY